MACIGVKIFKLFVLRDIKCSVLKVDSLFNKNTHTHSFIHQVTADI